MRVLKLYLYGAVIVALWALVKCQMEAEDDRDKRAVDFGLFVRNLLLKSAAASDAKSNISRNLANAKTAAAQAPRRRPTTTSTTTTTTTTSTTTTPLPFFFNKGPFKFPFDLSAIPNFNGGGFINFDYNDYGPRPARRRRPTTTTEAPTTTTTAAPTTTTTTTPAAPTSRRPIPRRPYGLLGKQKFPQFDYYNVDYNYDYNYDDDEPAADNTQSSTAAPTPMPPPARPQRPPTANRARVQGRIPQISNRFVYQNRQPDGIVNLLDNNCRYIGFSRSLCRYLYQ